MQKTVHARRLPPKPKPYEAAVKAGLIGCVSGPRDLAENRRKYLRTAARAKRSA